MRSVKEFAAYIQPVYVLLDWHWNNRNEVRKYIPNEKDIADTLEYLIENVKAGSSMVYTGGLFARQVEDEIEFGFMSIA